MRWVWFWFCFLGFLLLLSKSSNHVTTKVICTWATPWCWPWTTATPGKHTSYIITYKLDNSTPNPFNIYTCLFWSRLKTIYDIPFNCIRVSPSLSMLPNVPYTTCSVAITTTWVLTLRVSWRVIWGNKLPNMVLWGNWWCVSNRRRESWGWRCHIHSHRHSHWLLHSSHSLI